MARSGSQEEVEFSGRKFSEEEVALIQEVSRDFGGLGRTEMARTVCELLGWRRANGRLKAHECRLLLEELEGRGWLDLPELRETGRRGPRTVVTGDEAEADGELAGGVGEFEPIRLEVVLGGANAGNRVWKGLIARHHYIGYRVPVGANLRYLIRSDRYPEKALGCFLWASAAWKAEVRDQWIGWTDEKRRENLQWIVNNARFLIVPWVRIEGLASRVLSLCAHKLPGDWEERYGYRPLLMETFVDPQRFRGTCYRAANWKCLGLTKGRGRMDQHHEREGQAVKEIYVYPLCRKVQERLRTIGPPRSEQGMRNEA